MADVPGYMRKGLIAKITESYTSEIKCIYCSRLCSQVLQSSEFKGRMFSTIWLDNSKLEFKEIKSISSAGILQEGGDSATAPMQNGSNIVFCFGKALGPHALNDVDDFTK